MPGFTVQPVPVPETSPGAAPSSSALDHAKTHATAAMHRRTAAGLSMAIRCSSSSSSGNSRCRCGRSAFSATLSRTRARAAGAPGRPPVRASAAARRLLIRTSPLRMMRVLHASWARPRWRHQNCQPLARSVDIHVRSMRTARVQRSSGVPRIGAGRFGLLYVFPPARCFA